MINVRPARQSDLETHARFWYELAALSPLPHGVPLAPEVVERWQAQAARWMDDRDCRMLTAEDAGVLVGFAVARLESSPAGTNHERVGRVLGFALDVHRYYPGAGRALVAGLCQWLRACGASALIIDSAHSPVEQAFWRTLQAESWNEALWLTL